MCIRDSSYIARKKGKEPITYPLECLKPILKSTYGILLYQEQIMQAAQLVAGFSLAKADILRKAMSKKTASLMKAMKSEFIQGGIANGFSELEACLLYTSPSPRDRQKSRMPSSA